MPLLVTILPIVCIIMGWWGMFGLLILSYGIQMATPGLLITWGRMLFPVGAILTGLLVLAAQLTPFIFVFLWTLGGDTF